LYDGVETFVLFIGYPRSRHSLVAAILDAHPEIIIPHGYNVLGEWDRFRSEGEKLNNMGKYLLFYELQELSLRQARFGLRAENPVFMRGYYNYNIPGLWQGRYRSKIKV